MTPIENRFTQFDLSENDEYMAGIFTDLQIIHIRNQLAVAAQDMLNLTSAGKETDETYFRMLEHYRGKMLAFEGLIQYSDALKQKMNGDIKEEMDNQPMFRR